MLDSRDLIVENSLDRELYRAFHAKLEPHLDALLAVYSEDLFRYERYARGMRQNQDSLNPFSERFIFRTPPEVRLMQRTRSYREELPEGIRASHPLLSQVDPMYFIMLNRALIMGAEKLAHLDYNQKVFLELYTRKNSIFSFPFQIESIKLNTRHGGGHYVISLDLPLPPSEARQKECSRTVKAFVKDFKTHEQKEREEKIHLFAESAFCHGPRILFSHNNFLIYEFGEEVDSSLRAGRDTLRREDGSKK